jgi:hypothetical protein
MARGNADGIADTAGSTPIRLVAGARDRKAPTRHRLPPGWRLPRKPAQLRLCSPDSVAGDEGQSGVNRRFHNRNHGVMKTAKGENRGHGR